MMKRGSREALPGDASRPAPKRHSELFVRGAVPYSADLEVPGATHAAILRSPHARARIRSVTVDPGPWLTVLTGERAAELAGPIRHFIDPGGLGGRHADVRCLAVNEVQYAGQPVAAVVAETPHDAVAALDCVHVDYEPLPPVGDVQAATAAGAPRVQQGWDDNVLMSGRYGTGDLAAAFARADHVIEGELRIGRSTTAPIEPRAYLAEWGYDGTLTFRGTVQNPHPLRAVLSDSLGVPESAVRVVAPAIGGSFGLKMYCQGEELVVALLARLTGRPVRWVEDRRETLLLGGREQTHRFRVACDTAGTILGVEDDVVADVGAPSCNPGWAMTRLVGLTIPTGYRVGASEVRYRAIVTNKPPWQATRGFGKDVANLVMERIVDLVARRVGDDPANVRRRNLLRSDELPYRTNSGLNIDSGDYPGALDEALALAGYDALRSEQVELRASGRHLGVGIAFELTPEAAAGAPGQHMFGLETARVRMEADGSTTVMTGVTSPGGGNETGIARIVAGELGIGVDDVTVVQGDTSVCPYGFGNYSGRSIVLGGSAAALAARDIRAHLVRVAARMLGTDPAGVSLAGGQALAPAGSVPIAEVARAIYRLEAGTADDLLVPLESTSTYRPDNFDYTPDEHGRIQPYPTYSYAVFVASVEVDAETGTTDVRRLTVVHDCGTIVDEQLVEGQMHGAIGMGLGMALSERCLFDADGRLGSDRFKTYLLPRASDVPDLQVAHRVTPSPFTLLGTKGAGEAGVGGSAAAVINAVADAVAPLGASIGVVPLTPPELLGRIASASTTPGGEP